MEMQGSRNLAVNLHRLIAAKFLDSYNYCVWSFCPIILISYPNILPCLHLYLLRELRRERVLPKGGWEGK